MKRLILAACAAVMTVALASMPAIAKGHRHHHSQRSHIAQGWAPMQEAAGWALWGARPQISRHTARRHTGRGHARLGRVHIVVHPQHTGHQVADAAGFYSRAIDGAIHGAIQQITQVFKASNDLAQAMLRDLGRNPTGWRSQWCAVYLRQVLVRTGHSVSGTDARAISFAHYGRPAGGPTPGAIGVKAHHVFVVMRVLPNGRVQAISGNTTGRRVGIGTYSVHQVVAWRLAA